MDLCGELYVRVFRSTDQAIAREIEKIDEDIRELREKSSDLTRKALELQESLKKLDSKISMDTEGMTREQAKSHIKARLTAVVRQRKKVNEQIRWFEQSKVSMENSQLATEMETKMSLLKRRMAAMHNINVNGLRDNIHDIHEANEHVESISNLVSDQFKSAWSTTIGQDDDEILQEFLAEVEYEEQQEEQVNGAEEEDVVYFSPPTQQTIERTEPKVRVPIQF